jgi:protein SCO1/2
LTTSFKPMKRLILLILSSVVVALPMATTADGNVANRSLPDNSVYHIESSWRDQYGETFNITELQGKVRVVAFVYTYCEHTCPVIITRIKSILKALSKDAQTQTKVTLVTLDPQRDTVERVREYMTSKEMDDQRWQILVGSQDDVLALAALFDVRYKPMGESDIAHSNVITLVDKEGVIRNQLKGLGQSIKEFVGLVEQLNKE